jgi:hypothetical protein
MAMFPAALICFFGQLLVCDTFSVQYVVSQILIKGYSGCIYFRSRSLGTLVINLGASFGLRSCCVREGREV